MYQFLRGIITEKITEPAGSEKVILDVSGIGYEIHTSLSSLGLIGKRGETATVYTTLVHKEDQMTLFGFPSLIEKELFNLLFSVSGIGPKTALTLLNNLTVSEIAYSILNEDVTHLKKSQGIGEKTASRIILELKEKIKNWKHLPIAYSEVRGQRSEIRIQDSEQSSLSDARSVLQSLGYSNQEINQAISQIQTNGNHKDSETLVQSALKWLASVKR